MTFVLDASVTLAWCFRDEASPRANRLLHVLGRDGAVTTALWPVEVANALVVGERRGRLSAADTEAVVGFLLTLPVDVDEYGARTALQRALPLARAHGLAAYDALYLELALRRGVPLATLDATLARVARGLGVETLPE